MPEITTALELKEAIRLLEEKQVTEVLVLKEEFFDVLESIKPVNLIKSILNEAGASPNLIYNVIGTSIGLTAGYLSNKKVVGSSGKFYKKLLGNMLQFGVTTLIIKNAETIKLYGHSLIEHLFSKKVTDS